MGSLSRALKRGVGSIPTSSISHINRSCSVLVKAAVGDRRCRRARVRNLGCGLSRGSSAVTRPEHDLFKVGVVGSIPTPCMCARVAHLVERSVNRSGCDPQGPLCGQGAEVVGSNPTSRFWPGSSIDLKAGRVPI